MLDVSSHPMTRNIAAISDQLRVAIETCGLSRYAVAKRAGVEQAVLSRFMAGKAGMSLKSIDAVGRVLGLRLIADEKPTATKRSR